MRAFPFVFLCAALPLAAACSLNPFSSSDDGLSGTPSSGSNDDAGSISSGRRDAGSSSRDAGARGGSDAGARGDGGASTTRPDGGSSGTGVECGALSDCCATLPAGAGWADTCNQYVDLDNDTQCASLYGTYQNDGYCTGNPGGLSNNCYALESCCEFLSDPDYTTCEGYVSANVDGTCQSAHMNYVNEALCE